MNETATDGHRRRAFFFSVIDRGARLLLEEVTPILEKGVTTSFTTY